jgi:hypothetical protein
VVFLNWHFGLTQMTSLEDCRGTRPRFVERGYPHKSYHHHPNHSIWIWEW